MEPHRGGLCAAPWSGESGSGIGKIAQRMTLIGDGMSEIASNGTPLDELREGDWSERYGLGKFDTIASEKLHAWTLDSGQDAECGDAVDGPWWSALFRGEADGSGELWAGAILTTYSSGLTVSYRVTTPELLERDWSEIERNAFCGCGESDCPKCQEDA